MAIIVDDIGSFPLPSWISREEFEVLYPKARDEIIRSEKSSECYGVLKSLVLESFERKLESGIDVVTYPQHYDMHDQFLEPLGAYQNAPFLIDEDKSIIPEIEIIKDGAKELFEKTGKKIALRSCVTGPIELYQRTDFGTNVYLDILRNLSKSVNFFLKNSIINSKYIETSALSIDEPSIGYSDLLNVETDDLIGVLERSIRGINIPVQIHLHTMKAVEIGLEARGVTSITGEFAANPQNMALIKKKELDEHDKFLRAGITRTNIDSIIAEHHDRGLEPSSLDLIDPLIEIKKRVKKLDSLYGERISSMGPDCGLGSWPDQGVAVELLKRTKLALQSHKL